MATFIAIAGGVVTSITFGLQAQDQAVLAESRERSERKAKLNAEDLATKNLTLAEENQREVERTKSLLWDAKFVNTQHIHDQAHDRYKTGQATFAALLSAHGVEEIDALTALQKAPAKPQAFESLAELRTSFLNIYNGSRQQIPSLTHRLLCSERPLGISFLRDGKALIAAVGPTIQIWDLTQRRPKPEVISIGLNCTTAALAPNGELFVLGDAKGNVEVWDLATKSKRFAAQHAQETHAVGLSRNGQYVYARSGIATFFWDISDDTLKPLVNYTFGGPPIDGYFSSVPSRVAGLKRADRNNKTILQVWDTDEATMKPLSVELPWAFAKHPTLSADGTKVAADGFNNTSDKSEDGVRIYRTDAKEGESVDTGVLLRDPIVGQMAISPNGEFLARYNYTGMLRLWRTSTGELIWQKSLPCAHRS